MPMARPRITPNVKRPTSDHPGFPFQRIDYGPASSYAARSHAMSCRSTCAGAVSRISTCQRFADVCSRFSTRGLRMSLADFNVRTSDERRVAMPANAVCRTKWIEVFFVSSAVHHIERARMSSPLAAVRLSIASDGNSSSVEPSVDTSSPLRWHLSWMVSA